MTLAGLLKLPHGRLAPGNQWLVPRAPRVSTSRPACPVALADALGDQHGRGMKRQRTNGPYERVDMDTEEDAQAADAEAELH